MSHPVTELVIEAGHTERNYWRDLFRYRELFYFLAWRDVLVRYKQTVIGILWAVLRPLLTMVVFTFVFSRIAKLPAEGVPYPVMVFAAMLPWQLFATSLTEGSGSLINNSNLISKVYFPRLIVPASSVIVSFVDFAISMVLLGVSDGFLQGLAQLVASRSSTIHGTRAARVHRRRYLACGPEREIPGFSLHCSLHRPVRSLHFAGRFQQLDCSRKMAPALFAQSDGWCHRGFPLVHFGRQNAVPDSKFGAFA